MSWDDDYSNKKNWQWTKENQQQIKQGSKKKNLKKKKAITNFAFHDEMLIAHCPTC